MPLLASLDGLWSMAKYRKCVPPGRKNGQRWEECRLVSNVVSGVGEPPLALTCSKAPIGDGENAMTPVGLQAPPRPSCASQTVSAVVALRSMVRSLPLAKKPRARLSGDQKGKIASLVSGRVRASAPFMGRTQRFVLPSLLTAVNATYEPSGESTGGPARSEVKRNCWLGGGLITARMLAGEGTERSKYPASTPRAIAAESSANQSTRPAAGLVADSASAGATRIDAIQRNSMARSCADWIRSLGSFARHPRINMSSIGGASGWSAAIGSGSFSRIAVNTLSCDLPSKA